jgi:hypothetical protein
MFIEIDSPDIFITKIKAFKSDSLLMKEIGGYRTYEYTYNEKQISNDTMQFEIIIFGRTKELINRGQFVKTKNKEWRVIDDELIIHD